MKKRIRLTLLALLAIACAKEQGIEDKTAIAQSSNTVSVSLPETLKTALQAPDAGIYPVVWSEGDCISTNGVTSVPLASSEAGKEEVVFQFQGDLFLPFNILYPASASGDVVTFSPTQNYTAGSFASGAAPMWGTTDDFANVTLHHLSAVLKFPFKASGSGQSITRVMVSALGGEPLCGDFTMELSGEGLFNGNMKAPASAPSTVELNCGSGVALSTSSATDFFVCIPAGTYVKGFKVIAVDNNSQAMTLYFYTNTPPTDIEAGKVIEFPASAFSATESILTISTVGQLQTFAANASAYKKVVLLNDLTWPDGNAWTPINGFSGEFDGGMHCVTGLNAPLFNTLSNESIVRNLTLESDITQPSNGVIATLACLFSSGRIVNCHAKGSIQVNADVEQAGGLVAKMNGTSCRLTDCSCTSDIRINGQTASLARIWCGGVVGHVQNGILSNCRFSGTLVLADTFKMIFCGGIVGRDDAAAGVENCTNTGYINIDSSARASSQSFIGGIGGLVAGTATGCVHSGNLVCQGTSLINLYVGGICASCRGGASDCVNDGAVNFSVTGLTNLAYVGGVIGILDSGSALTYRQLTTTENAYVNIDAPVVGQNLGYISVGGITGGCNMNNVTLEDCIHKGRIRANNAYESYGTHGLILGGITGSTLRTAAMSVTVSGCVNQGSIHLEELEKSSNYVYAGGIIGLAASGDADSKALTLTVRNCSNHGDITRHVDSMTYTSNRRSFCGGICGAIGGDNRVYDSYDRINATLTACSNSGTLIFNRYTTQNQFKEVATVESYTGGIVGVSKSIGNFRTYIVRCENSGKVLSTSGYNGGIVGFVRCGTLIYGEKVGDTWEYTRNSGIVGMFDTNNVKETGSGYMNAGGIAGCLDSRYSNNRIEYCWNSGYVAASTAGTVGAGGIVGDLRLKDAVTHCKNSGTVRFKLSPNLSADKCVATGQISGVSADYTISYCGIGGQYGRKGNGTAGLDNFGGDERYVFSKFIYALTDNITSQAGVDMLAPGCVWWNGVDKLDWE